MLFILPARLKFFVNLAGSFFEREFGCDDDGSFALPIALLDRIFAAIDELRMACAFSRASAIDVAG